MDSKATRQSNSGRRTQLRTLLDVACWLMLSTWSVDVFDGMPFPLAWSLLSTMLPQAAATPQSAPSEPGAAALVCGQRAPDGSLPLLALGLGRGGMVAIPATDVRQATASELTTPGGLRLRAKEDGIKLDFPSGAEVMITPSLRLCLRGGEQTLPVLGLLRLLFTDGSTLEVEPSSDGRSPIRRATLVHGRMRTVFWPPAQGTVTEAGYRAQPRITADPLLVLGDGRAVYRAVPFGPILGLRAVLRPRDDVRFPAARFVLAGDVLAESLRRLPAHVPRKPVQFPQAPEAAQNLADLAAVLFAPATIERNARTRGPLVLALPQEWRLHVELGAATGLLTLGLYRADTAVPAVEWTVNPVRTELHLVRPFGGENGSPRYFLRGLDISDDVRALWPFGSLAEDKRWAEQELLRLGARSLRDRKVVAPQAAGN